MATLAGGRPAGVERAGLSFVGQGNKKKRVAPRLSRKNLPAKFIRFTEVGPAFPILRRETDGIGSAAQKRSNHVAIFASSHGTGGIDQAAATLQHIPRGREQASLNLWQFVDIRRGLTQANIGMAADHPKRRTRRVEQYAIERNAVP